MHYNFQQGQYYPTPNFESLFSYNCSLQLAHHGRPLLHQILYHGVKIFIEHAQVST